MRYRDCPICRQPGRVLEYPGHDAGVEYYRCDDCWHAWSHDKQDADVAAPRVTEAPSALGTAGRLPQRASPALFTD